MFGQFMEKEQETIIPTIYEQQIILTCKGHNKNKDTIEAIRNILAQQCKLYVSQVSDNSIYYWLLKIVRKYAEKSEIDGFIDNLFYRKDTVNIKDIINEFIGMLSVIRVLHAGRELIYLEEDRNILDWKEIN